MSVNESLTLCASDIRDDFGQVCPFGTVQHPRNNQRQARISTPGFITFIQSKTNNILTALVTFILTSS